MKDKRVIITPIEFERKVYVWKLLQQYLDELSKFGNQEKKVNGEYSYAYFDSYWEEKERFPFFIMVDNKVAGFIFVNNHSVISKNKNHHVIGEFYILPKFRKIGTGKIAAFQIFNRFPANWEIAQLYGNIKAIKFWKNVITEYTKGNYNEEENSLGPVQAFNSVDLKNTS